MAAKPPPPHAIGSKRKKPAPDDLIRIDTPHGSYRAIMVKGRRFRFLNVEIPRTRAGAIVAPLDQAVCRVCCKAAAGIHSVGNAYGSLLRENAGRAVARDICDECRADEAALRAMALQAETGEHFGFGFVEMSDRAGLLTRIEVEGFSVRRER